MRREIKISYYWNAQTTETIKEEHIEALEEAAQDRIFQMISEGYRAGELHENILMTDDDGEDGINYSGWWKSSVDDHAQN